MSTNSRTLSGALSAVLATAVFVFGVQIPSQGQSGKDRDVRVVNTTSDPVNTTIVGTPSVFVAGNPTVGLHPDFNKVVVANDPSAPAMIRDVDARHREPFKLSKSVLVTPGNFSTMTDFLTVPNGKRFVLEGVSAHAVLPAGEKMLIAVHATEPLALPVTVFVPLAHQGTFSSGDHYLGTEAFTLSVASGGGLTATAARDTLASTVFAEITVVGYFEDVP